MIFAHSTIFEFFKNIARETRETREKEFILKDIRFYFSVFSVFRGQIFLGFDALQFLDRSAMRQFRFFSKGIC